MTEIIPGIHLMPIPIPNNPLGDTNTYLIRGTEGWLLIDAGWNSQTAFDSMVRQLGELGLAIDDIQKIVVTHVHPDHYGLVGALKERSDMEVIMHRIERDMMLERISSIGGAMEDIEKLFAGNGAPSGAVMPHLPRRRMNQMRSEVKPDTVVEDGEIISTGEFDLQVIWTPGHAPGHICLYEPKHKLLFGGDHVLPVITPNISLMPWNGENPLGDFMRSLETLSKLDVAKVLPAHEYVYDDLGKRLEEIEHHHRHRNGEILAKLKDGPKTAYQASSAITWMPDMGGVRYEDLPPMAQRMALMETLAHLKAMSEDKEIVSFSENGTLYFKLP